MSTVLLFIDDWADQRTAAVTAIRKAVGLSVQQMLANSEAGKPVFIRALYDRSDPRFAERLRALFEDLDLLGVKYRAPQLLKDQEYDPTATYYELTADSLRKMNETREASMTRWRSDNEEA